MSNAKATHDSKTIESLLAKMEQMEQALQEKEQTIANLASKIKPTARKKVQYNIVAYLDSKHTELGINAKSGKLEVDRNKEGLPARSAKNVLSYLYGTGDRQPKYHQPILQEQYQIEFLTDIKDWLLSETIKPLVVDIINEDYARERDRNKENNVAAD